MKEGQLEKLKQQYSVLQKKYKLPLFTELNHDFDIEKLQERESEHLLKLIRITIIEKLANVVRFLELLMNPTEGPTPMFMYALLKSINSEVRKDIEMLYKEFSKVELASLSLDLYYDEKNEAKFVSEAFNLWCKEKVRFKRIMNKLGMTWDKEIMERNYLG